MGELISTISGNTRPYMTAEAEHLMLQLLDVETPEQSVEILAPYLELEGVN